MYLQKCILSRAINLTKTILLLNIKPQGKIVFKTGYAWVNYHLTDLIVDLKNVPLI
jgi:hypothetical protein